MRRTLSQQHGWKKVCRDKEFSVATDQLGKVYHDREFSVTTKLLCRTRAVSRKRPGLCRCAPCLHTPALSNAIEFSVAANSVATQNVLLRHNSSGSSKTLSQHRILCHESKILAWIISVTARNTLSRQEKSCPDQLLSRHKLIVATGNRKWVVDYYGLLHLQFSFLFLSKHPKFDTQ